VSPGSTTLGTWSFSEHGSTETICDGSAPFGTGGYECLCAKYDGVKVSDDACTECTENCETNMNYKDTFNECLHGSEETGTF
jgi:hypothetical protein